MPDAATRTAALGDLVELGRITGAYGVKGWVKVQPHSAQADVLRKASSWWLTRLAPETARGVVTSAPHEYKVVQARPQGATVVAQLAGIADREQAEALRGLAVQVSRSQFPAAANDAYYWFGLLGCASYTHAHGAPAPPGVAQAI